MDNLIRGGRGIASGMFCRLISFIPEFVLRTDPRPGRLFPKMRGRGTFQKVRFTCFEKFN